MLIKENIMFRLLLSALMLFTMSTFAKEISWDDFEDGELTQPVAWEIIRPGAAIVKSKDGNKRLKLTGETLVLADKILSGQEYCFQFNGGVTWGSPCRFVFLYQDENNYYSFGIGTRNRGIFRKLKGKEEVIDADALSKLVLPHKGFITANYKVYVKNDGKTLNIQIDKGGDGVDYDTWITDTNPETVAKFAGGRYGFMSLKGNKGGSFDNVALSTHRIVDKTATPLTYYVDAKKGNDSRSPEEAKKTATPWKTIGKAANIAKAGDTVLVAPGIYREMVVPKNRGGTDSPITFKAADPKNRPIVSGAKFINKGKWKKVEITDFKGKKHQVYKASIDWKPAMVYQGKKRMMVSQEPNQSNAIDPYELKYFMKVPKQLSKQTLKDANFFVQNKKDYWKGADLLLWDSYPNAIGLYPILAYDPASTSIDVKPFRGDKIGNKAKQRQDTYAIRNHLGILDQPGEYYIDTTATPHQIYVMSYKGASPADITASALSSGFNFSQGRENIVLDGFVITSCADNGINMTGRNGNHITLRNIKSVFNMKSGISGRFVNNITIEKCLLRDNHANGISFGNCSDMKILECDITENGDNGIWFGGGQPQHWNSERILIRDSYLHHARARRRHPDNYQMHQVRYVTIENCTFVQEGEQNMWCQYSDYFTLRNNIFVGGALGINSAIHNYVYNNIFWNSQLRYDRHLTNHPKNKDFYLPQEVIIRNNVFVNSSIAWPDKKLIDRFKVYTVDHNYYCIENAHTRSSWEWKGRKLALDADSFLITDQEIPAAGGEFKIQAAITWGNPAKLVFLYKDKDNYYTMGLGNKRGVFRVMNGKETCLFKDDKNQLRLPHNRGTSADYNFVFNQTDEGLTIKVSRTGIGTDTEVIVIDTDPAARKLFTSGKIGVSSPPKKKFWTCIENVVLKSGDKTWKDGFEDADIKSAANPDELTWTEVTGKTAIISVGGNGIGYGEGSIAVQDISELSKVFTTLPNEKNVGFDFRPAPNSPLIDAGIDVGIKETIDKKPRPLGKATDIGPYEVK